MWRRIWTIFKARNKEFFRDKSAFGWNFIFPFLVILAFSVMFTGDQRNLYKVGVIAPQQPSTLDKKSESEDALYNTFAKTQYIDFIEFDSKPQALDKLRHHRIDMLIDVEMKQYWVNKSSPQSYVVEQLFQSSMNNQKIAYIKESVTGREVPYVEWLFPGILGMNIMFNALFGVGYVVVRYRKNGVLKRLSVTPLKPHEFLIAQVISRMYILLFTTLIIFAGCTLIFGFECRGSYIDLLLVFCIGGFSMISLGLIVASRSNSEELAEGILNLITWPMMLLSEVWFSLEGAQLWVQKMSKLLPLTHLTDGARKIMNDGATLYDIRYHLIILVLMSCVFLTIGSLLFKWQKN